MVTRLRLLAIALAAASLVSGAARAASAQESAPPSHRTKPAISAPVPPEQQAAVKKANADYKAAKDKARADYRKALADAKAAHDQALARATGGDRSRQ